MKICEMHVNLVNKSERGRVWIKEVVQSLVKH